MAIIHDAFVRAYAELPEAEQVAFGPETQLFGPGAALDSLALVSLIVDVETGVSDTFGREVSLTDDTAMSREESPFASVAALSKYIMEMLERA